MEPSPQRIGRYEIVRPLGQGGMGALYLACDPKLDRQIAIKSPAATTRSCASGFARGALRRPPPPPHIVTIFDVGEHDGQPYIAMEYIQGQTLAEMIRGAPSRRSVTRSCS